MVSEQTGTTTEIADCLLAEIRQRIDLALGAIAADPTDARRRIAVEFGFNPRPEVLRTIVQLANQAGQDGVAHEFPRHMLSVRLLLARELHVLLEEPALEAEAIWRASEIVPHLVGMSDRMVSDLGNILEVLNEDVRDELLQIADSLKAPDGRVVSATLLAPRLAELAQDVDDELVGRCLPHIDPSEAEWLMQGLHDGLSCGGSRYNLNALVLRSLILEEVERWQRFQTEHGAAVAEEEAAILAAKAQGVETASEIDEPGQDEVQAEELELESSLEVDLPEQPEPEPNAEGDVAELSADASGDASVEKGAGLGTTVPSPTAKQASRPKTDGAEAPKSPTLTLRDSIVARLHLLDTAYHLVTEQLHEQQDEALRAGLDAVADEARRFRRGLFSSYLKLAPVLRLARGESIELDPELLEKISIADASVDPFAHLGESKEKACLDALTELDDTDSLDVGSTGASVSIRMGAKQLRAERRRKKVLGITAGVLSVVCAWVYLMQPRPKPTPTLTPSDLAPAMALTEVTPAASVMHAEVSAWDWDGLDASKQLARVEKLGLLAKEQGYAAVSLSHEDGRTLAAWTPETGVVMLDAAPRQTP